MAHAAKVMRSINSPCGLRCVDITAQPHGGYGWASFRRDPEDSHGWRADGWAAAGFETISEALSAACIDVPWLADATNNQTRRGPVEAAFDHPGGKLP